MKKLVTKTEQTIDLKAVSTDKFYGVKDGNNRYFISRDNFNDGPYRTRAVLEMTAGNGLAIEDGETLMDCIERCLENKSTVYEFDTVKELFKWLVKS